MSNATPSQLLQQSRLAKDRPAAQQLGGVPGRQRQPGADALADTEASSEASGRISECARGASRSLHWEDVTSAPRQSRLGTPSAASRTLEGP
jgi:hypothetical protein